MQSGSPHYLVQTVAVSRAYVLLVLYLTSSTCNLLVFGTMTRIWQRIHPLMRVEGDDGRLLVYYL